MTARGGFCRRGRLSPPVQTIASITPLHVRPIVGLGLCFRGPFVGWFVCQRDYSEYR